MTRPLRIGVVGLGAISRYYLAAIESSPDWRLAAVCDRDPARLAPLRGQHAGYRSHEEILHTAGLDAVVVTAPNDAHHPIARDVLAAGLPVCVEKPLALRSADADDLALLARTNGRCLFTAFHRRYNREIRRLIAELPPQVPVARLTVRYLERIEDHVFGDSWYLDPRRCGGGCVADNGPNAYDLVRLLIGKVRTDGALLHRDGSGVDRRAQVRLLADSGATARVELDWSYAGEAKDVEVRLADGRRYYADMLHGHPGFKQSLWHEYDGVLADFHRALAAGADPSADGLAALRLVEDTYFAAQGAK